jgi:hypothetical protein
VQERGRFGIVRDRIIAFDQIFDCHDALGMDKAAKLRDQTQCAFDDFGVLGGKRHDGDAANYLQRVDGHLIRSGSSSAAQ